MHVHFFPQNVCMAFLDKDNWIKLDIHLENFNIFFPPMRILFPPAFRPGYTSKFFVSFFFEKDGSHLLKRMMTGENGTSFLMTLQILDYVGTVISKLLIGADTLCCFNSLFLNL